MNRGEGVRRECERHEASTVASHAKGSPKECLRRRRPQRDDNLPAHCADLRLEPRKARLYLDRARLAVNAPRPARHPFEVFYDIGDIGLPPVDSRFNQALVEQLFRRSDKGTAGSVFGIARLLANQHYSCTLGAFSE